MTQQEILQGNKLIMFFDGAETAKFDLLGEEVDSIKYKDSFYPKWNLPKFNEDWNLLIPIVQKIKNTNDYAVEFGSGVISILTRLDIALILLDISLVWQKATEFIKWYNQNK